VQRFVEHFYDGEDGIDQGPTGGFIWDGRAATAHDQAQLPLFAPFELANRSPAELAAKLGLGRGLQHDLQHRSAPQGTHHGDHTLGRS